MIELIPLHAASSGSTRIVLLNNRELGYLMKAPLPITGTARGDFAESTDSSDPYRLVET